MLNRREGVETIEMRAEKLLSHHAFKRFCDSFNIYQKLYQETQNNSQREDIKQRMKDVFLFGQSPREGISIKLARLMYEPKMDEVLSTFNFFKIINQQIQLCERGGFNRQNFAVKLVKDNIDQDLLDRWTPKIGENELTGENQINEMVGYALTDQGDINLHIYPANVSEANSFKVIVDGLRQIAEYIDMSFRGVKVILESWMLGPQFENIFRNQFKIPKDQLLDFKAVSDKDAYTGQIMAMWFSKTLLEKFLKTGQKPAVRKLVLDINEFHDIFAK